MGVLGWFRILILVGPIVAIVGIAQLISGSQKKRALVLFASGALLLVLGLISPSFPASGTKALDAASNALDSTANTISHMPNAIQSSTSNSEASTSITYGQLVPDGNYEVTVNGISTVDHAGLTNYPKGIYLVVDVTMKNTNNAANTVDSSLFTLVDSKGNRYSADANATEALNPTGSSFFLNQLNPGESETGEIAFDIPKGITGLKLLIEGGFSTSDTVSFTLPDTPTN